LKLQLPSTERVQPVAGPLVLGPSAPCRREGLRWALGLGAAMALGRDAASAAAVPHQGQALQGTPAGEALHWRETALLALGTTIWIRAAHANEATTGQAIAAAVAAVQRVDAALSLFRPDSALAQLNRAGQLHAPPAELVQVLRTALQVARVTHGAFDPTVQPLWRAWYEAHLQGRAPSARELQARRAQLNWRAVQVSDSLIRFTQPGLALTLNGIAQGYAADCAGAALRQHGVRHALLDTGEWLPMGHSDQGHAPWRLALEDTRRAASAGPALRALPQLVSDGRAIACSSDDKMAFQQDRREHHILDPRTGHSPRTLATVLVAAPTAMWADALTKPLFMATAAQAMHMARRLGVDALVIDKAGRWQASPGWRLA
jgi:FAD:protein FMN transferase